MEGFKPNVDIKKPDAYEGEVNNERDFAGLTMRTKTVLEHEKYSGFSNWLRATTITAAALLVACGPEVSKADNDSQSDAEQQQSSSITKVIKFQNEMEHQATDRTIDKAEQLASKIGIDTSGGISFSTNGGVITEINGVKVPENLFTEAEREIVTTNQLMLEVIGEAKVEHDSEGNDPPKKPAEGWSTQGIELH